MSLKMSDIARIAGVSTATVSLAINNKPGISAKTRADILAIVAKNGYKPQRKSAAAHRANLGEVIFLVVTSVGVVHDNYRSLPFFNTLIAALSAEISEFNGTLKTVTIAATKLKQELNKLKLSQPVLVLGTDLTPELAALLSRRVRRIVFLDTYFSDISADFVTMDNYQGAGLAARYIMDQGYRRIGYFASNQAVSNFSERRRGFRHALAAAQLTVADDDFYFISPIESEPEGLDMANLVHRPLPPAIFCEDDYIALRLIKAAHRYGLAIPQKLAIMGFDDIYEGTIISPELSTIHVNVAQMAHQALQQLLGQLTRKDWSPQKTLIATALVPRQSL